MILEYDLMQWAVTDDLGIILKGITILIVHQRVHSAEDQNFDSMFSYPGGE